MSISFEPRKRIGTDRMNENVPEMLTVLPDPKLFRAARWAQHVCLGVAAIGILLGLMPLLGLQLSGSSSIAARASLPYLITALLCGTSLLLSGSEWTGAAVTYVGRAANLLLLCGAVAILVSPRIGSGTSPLRESALLAARFSVGFVALALVAVLVDKTNSLINHVVDFVVCGLCLLSLLLVSDAAFGRFALFGIATGSPGASALLI